MSYDYAASPLLPGPLVAQGQAIFERLGVAFPTTYFKQRFLPPKLNAKAWAEITTGNQPFLGLGWNGLAPTGDNSMMQGANSWTLLIAVRRQGTDLQRYFGDAQGPGVLTLVGVAAALLQGATCSGGTIRVAKVTNVAAEGWGDDCAIVALELLQAVTLPLADVITAPDGLGWFNDMITSWGWTAQDGTAGSAQSEWTASNG